MLKTIGIIGICALAVFLIYMNTERDLKDPIKEKVSHTMLTKEQAQEIVRRDVEKTPHTEDLSAHTVVAELEDDGWHVAYISPESGQLGGGAPAYIIDAETGAILKKYFQR